MRTSKNTIAFNQDFYNRKILKQKVNLVGTHSPPTMKEVTDRCLLRRK